MKESFPFNIKQEPIKLAAKDGAMSESEAKIKRLAGDIGRMLRGEKSKNLYSFVGSAMDGQTSGKKAHGKLSRSKSEQKRSASGQDFWQRKEQSAAAKDSLINRLWSK